MGYGHFDRPVQTVAAARRGVGNGHVVWRVWVRSVVDGERPFVIPKCAILSLNLIR